MAYQSWSVVFGEQPSAAKWNILGTNDAYFDSLIGSGTAMTSFTPTLSGRFTDADWTKDCKYFQLGKLVFFTLNLIAADATPMAGVSANAIFTLPVTAASIPGTDTRNGLGGAQLVDNNGSHINGAALYGSTTTGIFYYWSGDSVLSLITSTAPFTWTTSDEISVSGWYPAA